MSNAAAGSSSGARPVGVDVGGYTAVTAGYWVFTRTDGALRMLVLLHFNALGFSPVAIAFLFVAYELMGVFTNLFGGWLGARRGLQRTLVAGLGLQCVALLALTFQQPGWARWWSVIYVMAIQAISGIAKDLTKMSAKSAVKSFSSGGSLFRLVAVLTGSKNALKGVGFFLGAALLTWLGYDGALYAMAVGVAIAAVGVVVVLRQPIGKAARTPGLSTVLSSSVAINWLAAARLFLFGARDVWFVVAVPLFFSDQLGWSNEAVGVFMAVWVIGYGMVQSVAPTLVRSRGDSIAHAVGAERLWVVVLLAVTAALAAMVTFSGVVGTVLGVVVVVGLFVFGVVFAINSSLHSYLIVAFANADRASVDVGFYYSANAIGRLVGTIVSGVCAMVGGLGLSLWVSAVFVVVAAAMTAKLPASAVAASAE